MRSRCIAVLPNAGLGNMLFPWAHAHVFGALNGLPACAIGWSRPHIGPLLRGHRLRLYGRSFKQPLAEIAASAWLGARGRTVRNPAVQSVADNPGITSNHLFVWDEIPHWSDYFAALKPFRHIVKQRIWDTVNPSVRQRVMEARAPVIAVHIRCGDFRKLQAGEDFRQVGGARTPLEYFISTIQEIRRCCGTDLPVTVFTDGRLAEVQTVLDLPAVQIAVRNTPIFDLLLISRAQLIVVSASSTFGYWAGFLSDSPVLLHPDHIHASLRPEWLNARCFEGCAAGPFEKWPGLLVRNIKDLCRNLAEAPISDVEK
jgi:hypothetical protein